MWTIRILIRDLPVPFFIKYQVSNSHAIANFQRVTAAKGEPMLYNFEWDPDKARSNMRKHGVRFEDASLVFNDPMALTVFD